MRGIILAGGSGTRLHPMTLTVSKQLLPVYDKPMIYYPLSTLMLAGIKEILIISTPQDIGNYQNILGNGSFIGLNIQYAIQANPNGLAEAFIIGEKFIGDDDVCLILGDNVFYGHGLYDILKNARRLTEETGSSVIFGYKVKDPERYGVAEVNENNLVLSIEEKPKLPKSDMAVVGLYLYPNSVIKIAKSIKPSSRGELEITSINNEYLNRKKLNLMKLSRGFAWLDTGTVDSIIEASEFVRVVENRTNTKLACIEEIALNFGYINREDLKYYLKDKGKSNYYNYLRKLIS